MSHTDIPAPVGAPDLTDRAEHAAHKAVGNIWVRRFMRFGQIARGIIYTVLGGIALRLALGRDPKTGEPESLAKFLTSQRDFYKTKPDDAKAFLKTGLSDAGAGLDSAELAAWSQLCRVILNLHETITRY